MDMLKHQQKKWLVTGVAGFIGSHLLEKLLANDQKVYGVDNFITGSHQNLNDVQTKVSPSQWTRFHFSEKDITTPGLFSSLIPEVDYILHQAALGSVPRSIHKPLDTHHHNVDGFVYLLDALKDNPEKRLVYASSSSVYGDSPGLPKTEDLIGQPQSPYALSKRINEMYAANFAKVYGIKAIGLRYFNVFGPRQDPNGAYAAVIPKWIRALLEGTEIQIHGDGQTTRDFCYVDNVVAANLEAALNTQKASFNQVYNIACGEQISLTELFENLKNNLSKNRADIIKNQAQYVDFREGDIRHSLADISKAKEFLNYRPLISVREGIEKSIPWYVHNFK